MTDVKKEQGEISWDYNAVTRKLISEPTEMCTERLQKFMDSLSADQLALFFRTACITNPEILLPYKVQTFFAPGLLSAEIKGLQKAGTKQSGNIDSPEIEGIYSRLWDRMGKHPFLQMRLREYSLKENQKFFFSFNAFSRAETDREFSWALNSLKSWKSTTGTNYLEIVKQHQKDFALIIKTKTDQDTSGIINIIRQIPDEILDYLKLLFAEESFCAAVREAFPERQDDIDAVTNGVHIATQGRELYREFHRLRDMLVTINNFKKPESEITEDIQTRRYFMQEHSLYFNQLITDQQWENWKARYEKLRKMLEDQNDIVQLQEEMRTEISAMNGEILPKNQRKIANLRKLWLHASDEAEKKKQRQNSCWANPIDRFFHHIIVNYILE